MTFKEKVTNLLNQGLQERPELFLVDLTITDTFKVIITLDGDSGVILQDCIDISRAIEHNLDREEQDFSLEVASVGVGTPLKMIRQYKNNIGRMFIVKLASETIQAKLTDTNDQYITLSWQAREPKKTGKGKETVDKIQQIPYTDIIEAVVTVIF